MYETISTVGMSRREWLRIRKSGIGGSDAGAVCGLNEYLSAASVYLDKISETIDETDNEAMRIGRDLEDYVAKRFTEETGKKVRRSNRMYRSRRYPFMLADVDRLIVGEDAGLEIKTVSPFSADQWKDGDVPFNYLCQVMHYMIVLGKKVWYIAALIMGREFVWRRIEYDEELAAVIVSREKVFWNDHVIPGNMPEPDGSKSYDEALVQNFRGNVEQTEIQLIGFDERLRKRATLVEQMEILENQKNLIDQEIKKFMGNHTRAVGGEYRISWPESTSYRLDTKKLRAEAPETYEKFKVEQYSRKFIVKAA